LCHFFYYTSLNVRKKTSVEPPVEEESIFSKKLITKNDKAQERKRSSRNQEEAEEDVFHRKEQKTENKDHCFHKSQYMHRKEVPRNKEVRKKDTRTSIEACLTPLYH
jgi:hypothetical protein